MLSINSVSKRYDTPAGPLHVLENVSLTLEPGDAIAIMGPSGAGKSTLLYIAGALEIPTSGTVTLNGANALALDDKGQADFRNQNVGFIFQDHCLLPQCTVLENVLIPTLVAGGASKYTERARSLLEQVGLSPRLDHLPSQLSGGEKQRVAIARALIREPKLLLCDEPTGNLDRESAANVGSLILDLGRSQNTIAIAVTHSPELAERFPVRYELVDRGLRRV